MKLEDAVSIRAAPEDYHPEELDELRDIFYKIITDQNTVEELIYISNLSRLVGELETGLQLSRKAIKISRTLGEHKTNLALLVNAILRTEYQLLQPKNDFYETEARQLEEDLQKFHEIWKNSSNNEIRGFSAYILHWICKLNSSTKKYKDGYFWQDVYRGGLRIFDEIDDKVGREWLGLKYVTYNICSKWNTENDFRSNSIEIQRWMDNRGNLYPRDLWRLVHVWSVSKIEHRYPGISVYSNIVTNKSELFLTRYNIEDYFENKKLSPLMESIYESILRY